MLQKNLNDALLVYLFKGTLIDPYLVPFFLTFSVMHLCSRGQGHASKISSID